MMWKRIVALTDSVGIQKEAHRLVKLVLVMRATTECPESLKSDTEHLHDDARL